MDRKAWFIDFAKIAGRRNLQAYAIGIIRSIICNSDISTQLDEIRNVIESMCAALNDESLPWDVMENKKASAPTEAKGKTYHLDCTITIAGVETLMECGMK
ncbi:hypothetical protein [Desulfosporosinus sp.]|uniref:hypothetical protein n=1 Tax=Desulfosporosinus sp. TaxID=157907 RepID=UPI0025BF7DB8|nr:hypothetical protein [Desulfosporosinus sp.]MBC2721816.1 hypothetical protein [Desulfosporosinus sp.]MBC2726280.1 hypothetical protein [Desulfosporosinus sp.]